MEEKYLNSLNSIIIEGNLVRDPVLQKKGNDTKLCWMILASNRYFKTEGKENEAFQREVSFFNIEAWDKLADEALAKGKKGRGIKVLGRLKQTRTFDINNETQSRISIVAQHIEYRLNEQV